MEEAGTHLLGRQPLELQNMVHFPFFYPSAPPSHSQAEHFQVQDVLFNSLFCLHTDELNKFNATACHFYSQEEVGDPCGA